MLLLFLFRFRFKFDFDHIGGTESIEAAFVGSADGRVFAIDLETGCARWVFQAQAEVRSGIVLNDWTADGSPARAYFGDFRGNVYALDARSGRQLWTRHEV